MRHVLSLKITYSCLIQDGTHSIDSQLFSHHHHKSLPLRSTLTANWAYFPASELIPGPISHLHYLQLDLLHIFITHNLTYFTPSLLTSDLLHIFTTGLLHCLQLDLLRILQVDLLRIFKTYTWTYFSSSLPTIRLASHLYNSQFNLLHISTTYK
jgi:hypothetical protein